MSKFKKQKNKTMAYTNQNLEDFIDDLVPIANAWAGDFQQAKKEVGELWQAVLANAKTYYEQGGDRPPIPPRVP